VLDMAKRRVKEIDALPIEGIGSRINMYSVKNSSAAYLADLITQIYGGASSGASSASSSGLSSSSSSAAAQPATKVVQKGPTSSSATTGTGLSGEVQIIPNEKANTLIIKANKQDYLQILGLLEKLDTVPRQVLIQANIIEVTLGDKKTLGLEWNLLHEQVSYRGKTYQTSATSANSGTLAAINSALNGGKAAVPPGGLLYTLFDGPGNAIASIQAAASGNLINLLSSPRIVASDGKEARIEIGNEVPVTTGTLTNAATAGSSGTTLANTVTYRTVGLILKVKPSINESGLVNLQLSQEVSNVVSTSATDGSSNPTFSTRKIETEISIQEGRTLTIGGLIKDEISNSDNGIPYLEDVPVFGNLFGATTKERNRTELLLTITPYVMRNQGDAERINQQLDEAMDEVRAFTKKIKPNALDLAKKSPPPQPHITVSVDK